MSVIIILCNDDHSLFCDWGNRSGVGRDYSFAFSQFKPA